MFDPPNFRLSLQNHQLKLDGQASGSLHRFLFKVLANPRRPGNQKSISSPADVDSPSMTTVHMIKAK
ncbi:hypothetical protein CEXT_601461 [Caerostris extrusa]|uniref:Uncharacterized protein n=1 Tax=Caerostris extrusa TaxID=172846 RepID=A0AAV4QGV3_CAEEX|nr:hypothetical protein CEXT_601461 [Caerostris extrusa]